MEDRLSMSITHHVPVYLPEKGKVINWFISENHTFSANQKIAEALCNEQVVEINTIEKGVIRKILVQVGCFIDAEVPIAYLEFQSPPSKVVRNFLENSRKIAMMAGKFDNSNYLMDNLKILDKKRREVEEILSRTKESNYSTYYLDIIAEIDNQLVYYRKLLLDLYRQLSTKHLAKFQRNGFQPFHFSRKDECKLTQIPHLKFSKRARKVPNKSLVLYTPLDLLEKYHTFPHVFYGKSTSTYPYMEYKQQREGEPICDQYRVLLSNNCSIITMADGCNWGHGPEKAAFIASRAFIQYIEKHRDLLISTISAAHLCLRGIAYAHNAIISQKIEEGCAIGTTTLLGGVITKVILNVKKVKTPKVQSLSKDLKLSGGSNGSFVKDPKTKSLSLSKDMKYNMVESKSSPEKTENNNSNSESSKPRLRTNKLIKSKSKLKVINDYIFVFASIGDCKAFRWVKRSKNIEELTPESRKENAHDANDCGGRIGPYIEGGPDFRNLEVFLSPCEVGDIIIVCSDGVHDNFDPQMLGFAPSDFGLNYPEWKDGDPSTVNMVKSEYRTKLMKKVLYFPNESDTPIDFKDIENIDVSEMEDPTPEILVERFIDHCNKITKSSQNFMQENPGKRLPSNYDQYPGKMDHTTVFALKVADIPLKSEHDITKNMPAHQGYSFVAPKEEKPFNHTDNLSDRRRLFTRQNGAFLDKQKKASPNDKRRSRSLSPTKCSAICPALVRKDSKEKFDHYSKMSTRFSLEILYISKFMKDLQNGELNEPVTTFTADNFTSTSEFVSYLNTFPKSPDREAFISAIRKLQDLLLDSSLDSMKENCLKIDSIISYLLHTISESTLIAEELV